MKRRSGNIINIGSTAALWGTQRHRVPPTVRAARHDRVLARRAAPSNVRVILISPSEVITGSRRTPACAADRPDNPTKLRVDDCPRGEVVVEMDDRGFVTELTVFATNPKD